MFASVIYERSVAGDTSVWFPPPTIYKIARRISVILSCFVKVVSLGVFPFVQRDHEMFYVTDNIHKTFLAKLVHLRAKSTTTLQYFNRTLGSRNFKVKG